MSAPEHRGTIWQTNTDHMVLECTVCSKEVSSWDIASEEVLVVNVISAWAGHVGGAS